MPQFTHILGDATKQAAVITFINTQNITKVALYDLPTILADTTLSANLKTFMATMRTNGVQEIIAIGTNYEPLWQKILTFHNTQSEFDALLTEIEYWNGECTFTAFVAALKYARGLAWKNTKAGKPPTLSSYVGWINQSEADGMVPYLDHLYVHAYVKNAPTAFGYEQARLGYINNSNGRLGKNVTVFPIFSAEGVTYNDGGNFMGEWLQTNCIPAAEKLFDTSFQAESYAHLTLQGHMYFEYWLLSTYLATNCNHPCASGQYLYPDGTCHAGCAAPFTTTVQATCYSGCNIGQYTHTNGACSSTCVSPAVAQTAVGGMTWCKDATTTH